MQKVQDHLNISVTTLSIKKNGIKVVKDCQIYVSKFIGITQIAPYNIKVVFFKRGCKTKLFSYFILVKA